MAHRSIDRLGMARKPDDIDGNSCRAAKSVNRRQATVGSECERQDSQLAQLQQQIDAPPKPQFLLAPQSAQPRAMIRSRPRVGCLLHRATLPHCYGKMRLGSDEIGSTLRIRVSARFPLSRHLQTYRCGALSDAVGSGADACGAANREPYSITSSARTSNVGGTSRPSALAVLRLMTSSYLVGACTGRSAGLAPLRMRST